MYKSNLIAGIIGIALVCTYLGILIAWVPAPPLIIIMGFVVALMIYGFVKELREIRNNAND